MLAKQRGFTAIALPTLALGIGRKHRVTFWGFGIFRD
jgi:hypothetical protein